MFHYPESRIRLEERRLFFQTWLRSPIQLGTFAPISDKLASYVASLVPQDGPIVEVGSGTGRLTRALMKRGMPDDFATVELDKTFCSFLKKTLKLDHIIEGDARHLEHLIPASWVGQVKTIVSVIPFMYFSKENRDEILEGLFKCLHPEGYIIHVTYSPRSPFAHRDNFVQTRETAIWKHIPPSFVWRYMPASSFFSYAKVA